MEEQNTEITVIRSKTPGELSVYHASSLENEIRFYINEKQFISAIEENEENIRIGIREELECDRVKSKIKLAKMDYVKLFLIVLLYSFILVCTMVLLLFVASYFNSVLMYLIMLHTTMFVFDIVRVVVIETKTTPPSIKSKHSAEHMMVNFLEKNKRLPKSIKEVRTVSRFAANCGSRFLIQGMTEEFVSKIIASIMAAVAGTIYCIFFNNVIIDIIIVLIVYIGSTASLRFLLKNDNKFNFLTKPLKKLLTNITQCANTTKKVEDNDIYLAYLAAREWIKVVYPEYYKVEEDVFLENMFD